MDIIHQIQPQNECMRCHTRLEKYGIQPQLCPTCIKELGKQSEVKDMQINTINIPTSAYQSFDVKFGTVKEENGYLIIPTTLAAEMIQTYHISEIPWLKPYFDGEFVTVFKDGEELKKAVDEYHTRGKDLLLPFVVPHTDGIFCEKQCPSEFKDMIKSFVKREEMKGYVSDIIWDEPSRTIKGVTHINIAKNDPELIEKTRKGDITDVSIGFMCDWDGEGEFQGQSYMLRQTAMKLGHLAGIPVGKGKCSKDKCGLNKDAMVTTPTTHIHLKDEYYMKEKEKKKEESEEEEEEESEEKDKCGKSKKSPKKALDQSPFKYDSDGILHNTEVSSMVTLEELQAQLVAKDQEILALKDAQVSEKVSKLETTVHDKDVQIGALNTAIGIKDAKIAELEQKITKLSEEKDKAVQEELERREVVHKLNGLKISKIGDVDVATMSLKDLKMGMGFLDVALQQNGLSQGTQAAHDAAIKPSNEPKKLGVVGATDTQINAIKPKGDEK